MPDGHIQKHLHSMFQLLRSEETLKMAVKLESARYGRTRYLVVVSCKRNPRQRELSAQHNQQLINAQNNNHNSNSNSTNHTADNSKSNQNNNGRKPSAFTGSEANDATVNYVSGSAIPWSLSSTKNSSGISVGFVKANILINEKWAHQLQDHMNQADNKNHYEMEESCLLGIDCNEKTTVGLVLRILGDTAIRLDGDGGFCISGSGRTHIFKPVSVQAMWSALQTLHKVCAKARENKFYPGGPSHEWVSHYDERIHSDRSCLNEWNAMDSIESRRPPSPDAIRNKPTERMETEKTIRTALKEIIVQLDLDEVTSKYIRTRLEEHLDMNLTEYKSFIDQEMLIILGQMDAPTKIFDHVYLGSEWNASNLEELRRNGVRHILNVTREIDNFFPGMFNYFNVRVYDDEKTNLLKYWDNTFKYISQAKNEGSKVLVHCKMGVSRSASVVIAYAMKAYDLSFSEALDHVKTNRNCIKPNKNFLSQLETYQGMLMAMKNKEKLQRSKSDTNLRSTKDARLLPGSEPTPLIQAIEAAAKKANANPFQSRLNTCMSRPKSWSPENAESISLLPKQYSQSLENLPPLNEKNNVRLPCENGQSYSVSQNQVFCLDAHKASVKNIINELESKRRNEGRSPGGRDSTDLSENNPAENTRRSKSTKASCDKPISDTSAKPLSHDFTFNSLKRTESPKNTPSNISCIKSNSENSIMKTRSVDTNYRKPNASPVLRHSEPEPERSFLEWTERCPPTSPSNTPSSCNLPRSPSTMPLSGDGTTDLLNSLYRTNQSSKNVKNLRNAFALREKHVSSPPSSPNRNDSSEVQRPNSKSDASKRSKFSGDTESAYVTNRIARLADQFSKDFIHCLKKRCKSEENLYESADILSSVNKRLSTSSPSEYPANSVSDRTPFLSHPTFMWSTNRMSPVAKNVAARARMAKNRSLCRTVENLKLNFESRDGEKIDFEKFKEHKRGNSLPSSPVAQFQLGTTTTDDISPKITTGDTLCGEEINVRGLVDRYEVAKLRTSSPKANTHATSVSSPIFSQLNAQSRRLQNRLTNVPGYDNRRAIHTHPKPPPFPHSPTAVAKQNIALTKGMPNENTQSFASLRQHFNSTSAYNTM